jgi:hypothetical protein
MDGTEAHPDSVSTAPAELATLAAKVAALEAIVGDLKDRQEIHDVYLRYMRGFDRNDRDLLSSAFWPDVQINYGPESNSLDEFIVRHLDRHMEFLGAWGHLITNETVNIDGDIAHVESYVTALFSHRSGDPTFAGGANIIGGRYIDRLDRRGGEWRIAVREFVPHFGCQVQSPWDFGEAGSWSGTWDKSDLSYRRPLSSRPTESSGLAEPAG